MATLTSTPTLSPASAPQSPANSMTSTSPLKSAIPKPAEPLAWLWQCHICHRTYRLTVTRRCLDDGHYFCSGMTVISKRDQKPRVKRRRACASEFDYNGWKAVGEWKRKVTAAADEEVDGDKENTEFEKKQTNKKDCWKNCDYPSQCRWGARVTTEPKREVLPTVVEETSDVANKENKLSESQLPKTTFEDLLAVDKQNNGRESKFHEEMEEVDLTDQQPSRDQMADGAITSKALDDIELEIQKSIQRVSEMATEVMVQFRYPNPIAEPKKSRTGRGWKKSKPRSGEVTAF
ncbi:Exosome complex exonuclease dis3 [Elsinoe australis]|uniref:Exosome complex exonuclease dis3 n=1 Tax=Elsinoe australis TaxID=40998 RepID=A0A2P8A8E2_9PEZI|nr:Exosome complex exonuclease dis3 [Elsinoe australis]